MMSNFFFIMMVATRLMTVSPFLVEGQSMDPTLYDREFFLIDSKIDQERPLRRGEIVVFSNGDDFFYVKRIIGLPGETVRLEGNSVSIKKGDGQYQRLYEPYLASQEFDYGDRRYFPVPEGEYFVLGDNRAHSKDSRTFFYPFVSREMIQGRYLYP